MDSNPYYLLICYTSISILSLLGLWYCIIGFYYKSKAAKVLPLSPMIKIYYIYNLLWGFLSSVYHLYVLFLWRPDTVIYNAYFMYFVSLISSAFNGLSSVVEIFLCIDRCLSIILSTKYVTANKNAFGVFAVLGWFTVLYLTTMGNDFIAKIPPSSVTVCRHSSCISTLFPRAYGSFIRLGLGTCNMLGGIILYFLLKYKLQSSSAVVKSINKTAAHIIFATVLLDFLPSVSYQLFALITKISLDIGPFISVVLTLNIVLCIRMYTNVFKKAYFNMKTVVTISVPTKMTTTEITPSIRVSKQNPQSRIR